VGDAKTEFTGIVDRIAPHAAKDIKLGSRLIFEKSEPTQFNSQLIFMASSNPDKVDFLM
jgi:hypothetical protein